ncbi:MAG: ATP-binding protein [Candidatus Krumholzibacteriia bacterium]
MSGFSSSKKRLILLSGFLLAFVVVLNVSTLVLYKRSKDYLDNELGERLRSIATTLSHAVENTDSLRAGSLGPSLYTMLHLVQAENLLSNIVVVTSEGRTVVDLSGVSAEGELNPFIDLDFSAVTLARSGLAAATRLYASGDVYLKSAYAPLFAADGTVVGIIGVEAGATYFDVLRELGNAILVVDVASVIIVVVLSLFFYRQSLSLDRAQAAVIQGENLATMGRMVAGIAHEIRNPLSIIKTSAEVLAKKHSGDQEAFAYISEEVDNLNRILSGYLNFARAERQESRPHSIQKILKRCVMMLEPELLAKSIEVVEDYPAADTIVLADDKQIQQAVLNVMINAHQALDSGGRIVMALTRRTRFARVTITDDGPGIPRKNLKEIVKPFFTTKEHGSGLGMSIVRNIVHEHGGRLDIHSAAGSGTSVTIDLPLAADPPRT